MSKVKDRMSVDAGLSIFDGFLLAGLYPCVETAMFEDGAEVEAFGLFAEDGEIARQVGVFGGEDGFVRFDERNHFLRFVIVKVIFGDGEIVDVHEVFDLIGGVLLSDGETAFVRFICEPEGKLQLVVVGEGETCVVGIHFHVVGFDGIEAFGFTQIESGKHDGREFFDLADIEPAFAFPAFVVVAQHFGGKLIFVWSPVFPRADADVADDLASFGVEFVNDGLVNVQVNVVDVGLDGCVYVIVSNLPLPGESRGGFPPVG